MRPFHLWVKVGADTAEFVTISIARAMEMAQAKESASRGAKGFKGLGVTGVCQLSG